MNVGLSNLATLKAWLLAPALVSGTDYDAQIEALGLGVAEQLEAYCNRRFLRAVAAEQIVSGEETAVVLERMPVEAVSAIAFRDRQGDEWRDETASLEHFNARSGVVHLVGQLGDYRSQIRFTYTGGYHWEQLEPDAEGYPTAVPAGATVVPSSLLLAWRLQCEHVWTQRDKLGLSIASKPSEIYSGALAKVELLPTVVDMLRPFRRYSL